MKSLVEFIRESKELITEASASNINKRIKQSDIGKAILSAKTWDDIWNNFMDDGDCNNIPDEFADYLEDDWIWSDDSSDEPVDITEFKKHVGSKVSDVKLVFDPKVNVNVALLSFKCDGKEFEADLSLDTFGIDD